MRTAGSRHGWWQGGPHNLIPGVCPCPQVPIIPVVYSSFSSFYNLKTKLFTSGESWPVS
jgi:hypothetical protein